MNRETQDEEDESEHPQSLFISVPEAARLLGTKRGHTYELVKRGELPSHRFGGRVLIPRSAIQAIAESVTPQV